MSVALGLSDLKVRLECPLNEFQIAAVKGGRKQPKAIRSNSQEELKKRTDQLGKKGYISDIHLPMKVHLIFLLYFEERIEIYQKLEIATSQKPSNDYLPKINKWLGKFMLSTYVNAKTNQSPSGKNQERLDPLRNELVAIFENTSFLSSDVLETIDLWFEILKTAHIGNVYLAQLYIKEEREKGINGRYFYSLPRKALEHAYVLCCIKLLRICVKKCESFVNDCLPIDDLETLLFLKEARNEDFTLINRVRQLRLAVYEISSLNINDANHLNDFFDRISKESAAEYLQRIEINVDEYIQRIDKENAVHNPQDIEQKIKYDDASKDEYVQRIYEKSHNPQDIEQKIKHFDERWPAVKELIIPFLEPACFQLGSLIKGLSQSINLWEARKGKPSNDEFYHGSTTIIPKMQSAVVSEMAIQQLLGHSLNSSKGKGKKKIDQDKAHHKKEKNSTQSGSTQKSKQPSITSVDILPSSSTVPSIATPAIVHKLFSPSTALSYSKLLQKLYSSCNKHSSPSLRQALWHLCTLADVWNALDCLEKAEDRGLSLITIAINSSHKLLEQIYRSFSQSHEMLLCHNLRQYHYKLTPDRPPPPILDSLYLANNWSRYFYIHYEDLTSISTKLVTPPDLLKLLVHVANGWVQAETLRDKASNMIVEVCKYAEKLFDHLEVSYPSSSFSTPFLYPVQGIALQKQDIDPRLFAQICDLIQKEIERLVTYHPARGHLKQALQAAKQIQESIRQINNAKNSTMLPMWVIWSLFQGHGLIENSLHAAEIVISGTTGIEHELKDLAARIGLEMGRLGGQYRQMARKVRYPVDVAKVSDEASSDTINLAARLIDDSEAIRLFPEVCEGFQFQNQTPSSLWSMPSKDFSFAGFIDNLNQLLQESGNFLILQVLPKLDLYITEQLKRFTFARK
jgi:hypothetical protein